MSINNWDKLSRKKSLSFYSLNNINYNYEDCCNLNLNRIDVSGTWSTGWKGAPVKMYLTQVGDLVTGSYEFNNGKLIGTLSNNVLEGGWVQSDSLGNFRFVFSEEGTRFEGTWGFGKDSTTGGRWYGRKIELGNFNVTGTWVTNYNQMYLEQKDGTVVGMYEKNNGRLEGVFEGNELIGNWFESRYKLGSFDTYGSFRFLFNIDNTFTGTRGINESLTNEGPWNGKKVIDGEGFIKPVVTIETTGTWTTNFNTMYLQQTGFNVTGDYEYNKGKLLGVIYGDTMTGNWYQDINNDGTYETTGMFVFEFSNDGTSFKGTWGYGESFSNGGLWNGTKVQ